MMFKQGREAALNNARWAAEEAARNASYNLTGQQLNTALSQMIAAAVEAGLRKLLEEHYGDEDFEKDVGL